jgi:hypothetical protein
MGEKEGAEGAVTPSAPEMGTRSEFVSFLQKLKCLPGERRQLLPGELI